MSRQRYDVVIQRSEQGTQQYNVGAAKRSQRREESEAWYIARLLDESESRVGSRVLVDVDRSALSVLDEGAVCLDFSVHVLARRVSGTAEGVAKPQRRVLGDVVDAGAAVDEARGRGRVGE